MADTGAAAKKQVALFVALAMIGGWTLSLLKVFTCID